MSRRKKMPEREPAGSRPLKAWNNKAFLWTPLKGSKPLRLQNIQVPKEVEGAARTTKMRLSFGRAQLLSLRFLLMMPLLAMTALQIRKVIPMNNNENFNARLALKWAERIYVSRN